MSDQHLHKQMFEDVEKCLKFLRAVCKDINSASFAIQ